MKKNTLKYDADGDNFLELLSLVPALEYKLRECDELRKRIAILSIRTKRINNNKK
jgi:hypothetical protein